MEDIIVCNCNDLRGRWCCCWRRRTHQDASPHIFYLQKWGATMEAEAILKDAQDALIPGLSVT